MHCDQAHKIVSINLGNFGSTGSIARMIAQYARANGFQYCNAYPPTRRNAPLDTQNDILIGSLFSRRFWEELNRFIGFNGCYAWSETALFLRKLNKIHPALLHLHNLHNCYINLPVLFRYIKKHSIPVVWTLHDCWAFTGQCPYFTLANCSKWKTGCHHCPQYRKYPECGYDNTRIMYRLKLRWFTGVPNLTIVTPSQWLADLAQESFLSQYPVQVIHNGIDTSVFHPQESDFRSRYGLSDRHIVLGVSFDWGTRKGFDVFLALAKRLDAQYQIVLVGTNDQVDAVLPDNILSIHRTTSRQALAEIYAAADVFVNPTREENFPTVNMEALACGTPVVTFDTGGSPEIPDATCGQVVPCEDVDSMELAIRNICKNKVFSEASCLNRAHMFTQEKCCAAYVQLYRAILGRK